LTKAYKALTDEEVRNNYVQYGHPDGKQSFSIGIALPKFIITDGNGKYVLLVYGLLLGVLLPYVVGKWWYGTQRMTREKVLIASAGNLFQEFKDDITEGGVVTALSSGEEFKEVLKGEKGEAGLAKIEGRILAYSTPAQSAGGLMTKERLQLQDLDEGVRRKALGLLWAYIGRISLDSSELDDEKYEAAPIALALNEAFLAIALAFGLSKPILNSYHTSQNIIQAMPPTASPLLQLPHITRSIAAAIEGNNKSHVSIQQYMSLSEDKRRRLSIGTDKLTDSQYKSVVRVAKQMPVLHVEKAFFKVTGERFITPSSLVQFIVKARLIPPGTQKIPPVNSVDLEDVDPDEGDVNALLGRKKTRKTISADGTTKIELVAEEKPIQPTLAFAPYFARDHSPRWHVFLADSKQGKMAVPPFTFTTFDKPLYKDDGSPTFNVQTLKMQFQAPPQAGQYTFVMHMICDSYVGLDTKMEVVLPVQEMSRAEEMVGEDEISEPDEGWFPFLYLPSQYICPLIDTNDHPRISRRPNASPEDRRRSRRDCTSAKEEKDEEYPPRRVEQ
jgi:translocation protein SEC63